MVKVKTKRNSGLADKVRNKRQSDVTKKKLNPFEVHNNREKIQVLGKKSKHDRGLPGVSRAKAIQKRKETLGTEMKLMNKTNAFIDRRIGERDTQLSAEDRMIARFTAERAKQHSKKNLYNLADDEILTHRGQTLEQIEKFDDPRSEDEDDEDGRKFGGLGDEFVAEGHFGGGMLKTETQDGAKSHKDLIEQLIAESKKRKAEKQKEKEQTLDLTEKLDSEWKDLQPVVFKRPRVEEPPPESAIEKVLNKAEKEGQDYDKMMRELKFEKRGTPSDALKSVEKQAKEEQAKLEEWERERQRRMMPEEDKPKPVQNTSKHRSADDLDDNFELDDEKEFMLAYDNDGKPLVPESVLKDFTVPNQKPKFDDGISDSSDEDGEESEEDEEEIDETGEQDDHTDAISKSVTKENKSKEVSSEDDNDDDDDDESSESNDKSTVNIIKEQTEVKLPENSKQAETKPDTKNNDKANKNSILFQNGDKPSSDEESDAESDGKDDESEVEGDGEASDDMNDMKDLKYSDGESDVEIEGDDVEKIGAFFNMKSEEGDKLKELLTDKTPSQQSAALQKLIKSYDPSLGENNKELLSRLFAHLLQYVNDIFTNLKEESDVIKAFLTFNKLIPHFFDLVQLNKVSSKKFLAELLKEKHERFMKHPKKVPDLDTLIFFKLVSLLYPTSDFRHPVATPSLIFMTEILTLAKFNNAFSISRGLFLTALILEYTVLSKRYVPPAVNFLRGILYLSANLSVLNPVQVVPPFRLHRDVKLLNLEGDCSKIEVGTKMAAIDLVKDEIDSEFKIRSFATSVLMLREFFNNYTEIQSQDIIFEPHLQLIDRIDLDLYPKKISGYVEKIIAHLKESLKQKSYVPLSKEKVKPKALRLYEPDIQEVFTGSKSSKLSREQADRARLQTKLKREMKGALREVRRDKAYIASVKIRNRIHSDNIRKEKVRQIYKDASVQQGEINKLKRMK